MNQLSALKCNLERKPQMRPHFLTFMEKVFENGHAEVAPPFKEKEERWYLLTFGVYHPKKPGNICMVFDSSTLNNRYHSLRSITKRAMCFL